MGQDALAAVHLVAVERIEPDRLHPVKRTLAQFELIDVRRRRPAAPQMHEAHVVYVLAEARVRFQPLSVRQIDFVRRDVVDRGVSGVARQRVRERRVLWWRDDGPRRSARLWNSRGGAWARGRCRNVRGRCVGDSDRGSYGQRGNYGLHRYAPEWRGGSTRGETLVEGAEYRSGCRPVRLSPRGRGIRRLATAHRPRAQT